MRTKIFRSLTLLLAAAALSITAQNQPTVRLKSHVLPALQDARRLPKAEHAADEPITLTITLNWSDQAAFDAFGKEFEDPNSPDYHHLLSAEDVTARFGPTQANYDRALAYFQQQGFTLVKGSANRLTITIRGVRSQAERLFHVSIDDYQLGDRTFHANSKDPVIPQDLAPFLRSVSGLSNLAVPHANAAYAPATPASIATAYNIGGLPAGINGAGQTIGLIEYDNFVLSDVANWLIVANLPANLINQVSTTLVDGQVPPSGCNPGNAGCGTTEVLLDIDAALGMATGANIIAFVGPQGTDTIDMMNAAIIGVQAAHGSYGGIISTSWNKCEREISDADLDSLESLMQSASYSGLTIFAGSGDYGSTCVGGGGTRYANRMAFPAVAPHVVSVGGTNIQVGLGSGNAYLVENWWDSSLDNGNIGTASFGYSWHFAEPSYQLGFVSLPGRSIPDVAAEAGDGISVCQAFGGVSPNCFGVGGTSLSAPLWAGVWALTSQEANLANGVAGVPAGGGYLYSLPQLAFHSASSMSPPGNDFAHLGLGSPNIANLVSVVTGKAQITGLNPSSGPVSGGTTVTIRGHGFVGVSKVLFGGPSGAPAASFQVISESQIQAVTPPCPSDSCSKVGVDGNTISVLTPAGYSQPTQIGFYFLPGVTGVSPNSGSMDGGTAVTVTGSGFAYWGTQSFYFGSVPAINVHCDSSTVCTMASPRETPGTVNVTAGTGLANPGATFTFTGPSITRIDPAVGPQIGGTYVNIYGSSLSNSMVVKFGGTQVGAPLCEGDTWCTVYSPAGTGSVHITATIGGLTTAATAYDVFTFEPLPYGTLSPNSGPASGGTVVTVTGGNFDPAPGATSFTFSSAFTPDQPATNVSCSSTQVCILTTPPCNSSCMLNAYAVVSVTVDGATRAIYGFTYVPTVPPPPPPPSPPPHPCRTQTSCM